MAQAGREPLRNSGTAARWARWLMWVQAVLSVLAIAFAWMRGFEPKQAEPAEAVLLVGQFLLFIAAFVAALRWIYLANSNARALGAQDMMVSPGWAVGWFFVPLMNLVMPFMMMRELWKASAKPSDWQLEPAPAAILLWWVLWVASAITSLIALQLSMNPEAGAGAASEFLYLLSDLVFIPAVLLFAWLIGKIEAMQTRNPAGVFA
jgi:hypothetical protein